MNTRTTKAKAKSPSRTAADDHTPWTAELVKSGFDAGFHQVVNSEGWVIATRLVTEDAQLLAAAPDLLKVCKRLLPLLPDFNSCKKALSAAIDKAEGR